MQVMAINQAKADSAKVDLTKADLAKTETDLVKPETSENRIAWWSSVAKIKSVSLRQNIDKVDFKSLEMGVKEFKPLSTPDVNEELGLLVEFYYFSDISHRVTLRCIALHSDWDEITRAFAMTVKNGILSGPFSYEDFAEKRVKCQIHSCVAIKGKKIEELYSILKEIAARENTTD
jgi:hypothetical protein